MKRTARPGSKADSPARGHDDDAIVELTRVAFVAEALAIKQDLERIGIRAAVFESDAGGWAPHLGIEQGIRVMVSARDADPARQLLSPDGGQLAVEQPAHPPAFTKHRRRHPGNAG